MFILLLFIAQLEYYASALNLNDRSGQLSPGSLSASSNEMSLINAGNMIESDALSLPPLNDTLSLADFEPQMTVTSDLISGPGLAVPLLVTPEADLSKVDFALVVKMVSIIYLIVVIVIGNGMVMVAVRLDRTILALSQSSFLFSMALADALVGIFVVPMALLQIVYEYWPLQPILCILYRCLDVALCTASILHLCAISMDRFWSLRIDYTKHHRARNIRIMIIVVWLLSFIICLPSALPSEFDMQYLKKYISGDPVVAYQSDELLSSRVLISPYYILDVEQGQTLENTTSAYDEPTPSSIVLPDRPRGNNKVLQSLEDVGGIDCIAPTPFDWLFPQDEGDQMTRRHCSESTALDSSPVDLVSVFDGYASAAFSDNFSSADLLLDQTNTSYHCTLIDDLFYTFASASMSFYIPLVITIVMNVLTYWIAKRTAKAAIKRLNAPNPAAVMLRAVIPMPISRNAPLTSTTNIEAETPTSPGVFQLDEDAKRRLSIVLRCKGKDTAKDTSSSSAGTSQSVNAEVRVETKPTVLKVENSPNETIDENLPLAPKMLNGIIKRDSVAELRNGKDKKKLSFDTITLDKSSPMGQRQMSEVSQDPNFTAKNLVSSVLHNLNLFSGGRQSVISKVTSRKTSEFDRNFQSQRADRKRRAKQRERKAALVLIIVTVTFIVCWLPFFTIFPLTRVIGEGIIPNEVFQAAVWLGYVNSAVNPVIYTIFNEEFRRAFKDMFLCRWNRFSRY